MKERPILFSGAMVRAILDGRKTQTRRIIKHQRPDMTEVSAEQHGSAMLATYRAFPGGGTARWGICECPYGAPGDRLWVRETHSDKCPHWPHWCGCGSVEMQNELHTVQYRADNESAKPTGWRRKWTPAIHMRRAFSRLTLAVEAVRVERLHDISDEDARAEGCDDALAVKMKTPPGRDLFAHLWTEINGADSWVANPWVWVVTFRREVPNE